MGWQKDFLGAQSFPDPLFNGADIAASVAYDPPQVDDPTINRELSRADALTDSGARARMYANVDRQVSREAHASGGQSALDAHPGAQRPG